MLEPPGSFSHSRGGFTPTGGAPAFRDGTGFSTSHTSLDAGTPTTVAGDYLIASVYTFKNPPPTITPPSGWTLIRSQTAGTSVRFAVYYRVSPGPSPSSYTFTLSSTAELHVTLSSYSGVSAVQASDVATSTGSTATAPSLTPTASPTTLLALFGTTATSASAPTSMADRAWTPRISNFDQSITGTSATGGRTTTLSGSSSTVAVSVLLAPAGTYDADVDLAWTVTPDPDATGYRITRSPGSATSIAGRTTLAWTDTTTTAATAYIYTIEAVYARWRSTTRTVNVAAC